MADLTSYEQRLDRIEQKLDKVSETITNIVRLEERVVAGNNRADSFEAKVNKLQDDVDNLKSATQKNELFVKNSERLIWALITTGISTIVYLVK